MNPRVLGCGSRLAAETGLTCVFDPDRDGSVLAGARIYVHLDALRCQPFVGLVERRRRRVVVEIAVRALCDRAVAGATSQIDCKSVNPVVGLLCDFGLPAVRSIDVEVKRTAVQAAGGSFEAVGIDHDAQVSDAGRYSDGCDKHGTVLSLLKNVPFKPPAQAHLRLKLKQTTALTGPDSHDESRMESELS